eukprot:1258825-Lingulodinium_polyedra.AAC.1
MRLCRVARGDARFQRVRLAVVGGRPPPLPVARDLRVRGRQRRGLGGPWASACRRHRGRASF